MHTVFYLALFLIPGWLALKRDYKTGCFVSIALLSFMTNRLTLPSGPFELTFQRIMLMVLAVYWWRWYQHQAIRPNVPNAGFMWFWWVMALLSTILSFVFVDSLKWFISFSSEMMMFYYIVATTVQTEDDIKKAVKALSVTFSVVAVLGVIEYYRGFNPALQWMGAYVEKDWDDVVVTFQHRILFGNAMSMGWPILLVLALEATERKRTLIIGGLTGAALACCYFSNSRGAWFGTVLAGGIMFLLGSAKVRRVLVALFVMSLVALVARPGIRDTLVNLVSSTWDPNSYRGASYYYRKELWPVARSLANESPIRAVVGCGPVSLESMDLSSRFKYGGNTYHTGFSSWDNNYAANLAEFGYVGLMAEWMFYAAAMFGLWKLIRQSPPGYRDLIAALTASISVFLLAQTNVYMFSPQLKCMFLTEVALAGRLAALFQGWVPNMSRAPQPQPAPVSDPSIPAQG